MTRSADDFNEVLRLVATGMSDCAIARETGIPRPTVRGWRTKPPTTPRRPRASTPCGTLHDFASLRTAAYAYLLGMYLGDGCISLTGRSWRLRIACDMKYPTIIDRCRQAIDAVMPGQRAALVKQKGNSQVVYLYSNHWPCLFPQHGPGRKHHRKIALAPWQQEIVDTETEEFALGLIHSDGCRVVANDQVSIYRKADTARMDEFIGPKSQAVPWTNVHYTA